MKLSRIFIKAFYTWELPPLYSDKSATSSWPPVYSTERLFCFIGKITNTSEVVFHLSESIEAAPPESFCETLPLLWGLKWYLVHITSLYILTFFLTNWSYDCNFVIAIEYLIKIFEIVLNSVKRHPTMPHLLLIAHRLQKLVDILNWLRILEKLIGNLN